MDKITQFGNTDLGRIRTNNEDTFIIQNIWDENHILAVVIDGVGGYEGGEVAAELARKSIIEYLESYPNGERLDLLKQAVIYANNAIFAQRSENAKLENMSCVLTSIIIEVTERRINMAHIGDTRLYQYAYGEISKLSHDHSLVGYREEIGELTEEQAMQHPQRNVISRDVGSTYLENSGHDYVEVATFCLIPRSTIMLCSDGLCDVITSLQMSAVLEQKISIQDKVAALIDAANNAGGKDNITVVIVGMDLDLDEESNDEVVEQPISTPDDENQSVECEISSAADVVPTRRDMSKWGTIAIIVFVVLLAFVLGYLLGVSQKRCPSLSRLNTPTYVDDSTNYVLRVSSHSSQASNTWSAKNCFCRFTNN